MTINTHSEGEGVPTRSDHQQEEDPDLGKETARNTRYATITANLVTRRTNVVNLAPEKLPRSNTKQLFASRDVDGKHMETKSPHNIEQEK